VSSHYLQQACDLAAARGYLSYPEVVALAGQIPDWFRALGNDEGRAEFEARRGFRVPPALGELYGNSMLASFLEATLDGEVFLRDLDLSGPEETPPLVTWATGPHLVFAFHNHSGAVCAVRLGDDDPSVVCGFENEPEPFVEHTPETLSEWVFKAVDGYEAQLSYWQAVYEECRADPSKARRMRSMEWIRRMPGMAQRLD